MLHADKVRAASQGQRRHVDLLDVPGGRERRIARDTTSGVLLRAEMVSAVMIWVKPGPQVVEATPTLPLHGVAVGHGDGAVLVRACTTFMPGSFDIATDQYMLASPIR